MTMEEWAALKELEDLADRERREARSFTWDNARHWLLATAWGLLAAFALGFCAAYALYSADSSYGTQGVLTLVLALLVVLPLVSGFVLLLWLGFFAVFPNLRAPRVQVTASVALCLLAVVLAHSASPGAIRARRALADEKRQYLKSHADPQATAVRAEPRPGEAGRSTGASPLEGIASPLLPEIVIERPQGGVRLTNASARTLAISAVLQPELGRVKSWTGRAVADCAALTGPQGETPAPMIALRPGEQATFLGQSDCAGLDTAPVQLTVLDEQKQPVLFTLKFRR
jgi:hypothetical protein